MSDLSNNPIAAGQRDRSGFTMVEMLVTVAGLIIVLGLMVSLARYVRERAAVALTKELLRQLDDIASQYAQRYGGQLPPVTPFPPSSPPSARAAAKLAAEWDEANSPADRAALLAAALENNRRFVAVLKAEAGSSAALNGLPLSMYNDVVLRDAWGTPLSSCPPSTRWSAQPPTTAISSSPPAPTASTSPRTITCIATRT